MFHMGTKAHYVSSTLKFGGARYRPTGRGFVMRHESFAEIYRFFAASHFTPGFELLGALLLWLCLGGWGDTAETGVGHYWRSVWASWAMVVAWLFAPFWFNPVALDWRKLEDDLTEWRRWMAREGSSPSSSWLAWFHEECSHIYATRSSMKMLHVLAPAIRCAAAPLLYLLLLCTSSLLAMLLSVVRRSCLQRDARLYLSSAHTPCLPTASASVPASLLPTRRHLITFLGLINAVNKAHPPQAVDSDLEAYAYGLARVSAILAGVFVPVGIARVGDWCARTP